MFPTHFVHDTLNMHIRLHYLRHLHIVIRGLSAIVTRLPLPLVADTLDEVLVEVTDVEMSNLQTMKTTQQMSEQQMFPAPTIRIMGRMERFTVRSLFCWT